MVPVQIRKHLIMGVCLVLFLSATAWGADGDLDTSFDVDGVWFSNMSGVDTNTVASAIQADGKIMVFGLAQGGDDDFFTARLNTDGTLDTSYDTNGWMISHWGNDTARDILIQDDGQILLIATVDTGADDDIMVIRLNPDGSLDTTFNGTGMIRVDYDGGDDNANSAVIQDDGKIVVCGNAEDTVLGEDDYALLRLNADGTVDTTFGVNGWAVGDYLADDIFIDVGLLSDGRIVAVGAVDYNNDSDTLVAMFTEDGILDTSFGANGVAVLDWGGYDLFYALAVREDNKIIVAGAGNDIPGAFDGIIAQYLTNGELDPGFATNGQDIFTFGNYAFVFSKLAILDDGSITGAVMYLETAGGDTRYGVLKLLEDGSADTSFDGDGLATPGAYDPDGRPDLAVQDDGYLILNGGYDDTVDEMPFVCRFENTVPDDGDSDNDGVPDADDDYPNDASRANIESATGSGEFILDVSGTNGAMLADVTVYLDDDAGLDQTNKPGGVDFTDGVLGFTVKGIEPGATITVEITCPTETDAQTLAYKIDGTGFVDYTASTAMSGYVVTLTLTDGGDGDADGLVNSEIVDPLAMAYSDGGGSSGGGGCTMAAGNGALGWLLMILGPALLVLRRHRQ